MNHSNIMRLDSKGRLLIPVQLRKKISASEGTEMVLIHDNDSGEIRIVPLVKDRNAELRLIVTGIPESFTMISNMLSSHNISVLMGETRIIGGKMAEWNIIVDTSKTNNGCLEKIKNEFQASGFVKGVEIIRK